MRRILISAAVIGFVVVGLQFTVQINRSQSRAVADDPFGPAFVPARPTPRVAEALEGFSVPVKTATQFPVNTDTQPRMAGVSNGFTAPAQGAPSLSRVTLVVTSDHQVHIIAASGAGAQAQSLEAGDGLTITAIDVQLQPSKEAGGGNLIRCQGAVEVRNRQFVASGDQLTFQNNQLILEGRSERPATLIKYAAADVASPLTETMVPIPDQGIPSARVVPIYERSIDRLRAMSVPSSPPTNAESGTFTQTRAERSVGQAPLRSEYTISASRISFTLTLDQVQVGSGTAVTPISAAASESRPTTELPPTPAVPAVTPIDAPAATPEPLLLPAPGIDSNAPPVPVPPRNLQAPQAAPGKTPTIG